MIEINNLPQYHVKENFSSENGHKPQSDITIQNNLDPALESYIKGIYVFNSDHYSYLQSKLDSETFEKVCIGLIGGKSYNVFKMLAAGINCPPTVPLTTNFYFDLIGPEIQNLVADIFQECGGPDNIHYPHNLYTSENIVPIGNLIKDKIRKVKLSVRAEQSIKEAYLAVGGYSVDKIIRSAKVAEDSPNASFAGCGDSNAQFIQPTLELDYELFRFNVIEVAASGFNFVGIENMLRMTAENLSNFNPKRDPMAETIMSFVYPANYKHLSDTEIVNKVSAAYVFHDQLGFDGRRKIKMQITNGTGATIADSSTGLPLVTVDKEVYAQSDDDFNHKVMSSRPEIQGDNKIYFVTDSNGNRIEYIRIFTPPQDTCYLINEKFDYLDSSSDRKKRVTIPEICYKPANDIPLIFEILERVNKINQIYPDKAMESEYAMVKEDNSSTDIYCVQTRPITVDEKVLVGFIPVVDKEVGKYVIECEVYATGAASVTVYDQTDMPNDTSGLSPIGFMNSTITQEDAPNYKKPNIAAFVEQQITGNFTHGAVQAREMQIPCVSGVGKNLFSGQKYYVFAYPNGNGKGMVIIENEETKNYIKKLEAFHKVQLENSFNIKNNLQERPLNHFKLGVNISSSASAQKYAEKGIQNCTLYRPNSGLSSKFKGFDIINPVNDPKFAELFEYLFNDVYNSAVNFKSFNYRHCSPQFNEHFAIDHPSMQSIKSQFGDDKFSAMQGATFTCVYPDFFKLVEIPMIKAVLERLKSEGRANKIKFTIEFPKSAEEVNIMLRLMEAAGLHEFDNLSVGPMIENVQMALDIDNVDFGKFKSEQIAFSFATNDLGSLVQGIDRQKNQGLPTVSKANGNPNPLIEIIQLSCTKIKSNFPSASISLCGEIAAALDPYVVAILYNLGIREFAMPTNPAKFGKIFEALHIFEQNIDLQTDRINMPTMVRLNPKNSELRESIQNSVLE